MNSRELVFCILASSLILFTAPSLTWAYEGDGIAEPGENTLEELRKAAQNPKADGKHCRVF